MRLEQRQVTMDKEVFVLTAISLYNQLLDMKRTQTLPPEFSANDIYNVLKKQDLTLPRITDLLLDLVALQKIGVRGNKYFII